MHGVLDLIEKASKSDAATVALFAGLSHRERDELAAKLNRIGATLRSQAPWVPQLCSRPFMVLVTNALQANAVQVALFSMGCGYHNGDYENLLREVTDSAGIAAIHVGVRGAMSVSFHSAADRKYREERCADTLKIEVSSVLAANSLDKLVTEAQLVPN